MAAPVADSVIGTDRLYTLKKKIGSGQFSTAVYQAVSPEGDLVAIKEIPIFEKTTPAARDAILTEVALLQDLNHPNIIQYLDSFLHGNNLFIVMEWCNVGDLKRLINRAAERETPLAEKTIWKMFYQISNGLRFMHEQRVLHRDIKPANIFVSSEGKAKIGDFGLGRIMSSGTNDVFTMVGTPVYMAPERIMESGYSFPADIWALGCVLYEMASLQNPFCHEDIDLVSLINLIQTATYAPLPDSFSATLQELVASMLQSDPTARPTATEVYMVAREQVRSMVRPGSGSSRGSAASGRSRGRPSSGRSGRSGRSSGGASSGDRGAKAKGKAKAKAKSKSKSKHRRNTASELR